MKKTLQHQLMGGYIQAIVKEDDSILPALEALENKMASEQVEECRSGFEMIMTVKDNMEMFNWLSENLSNYFAGNLRKDRALKIKNLLNN